MEVIRILEEKRKKERKVSFFMLKHGKEVWIRATYNPILDERGEPCKVIKFATVVTDEKVKSVDFENQIAELESMSHSRELSDIEQLFAAYPLHIYIPESATATFKRILKAPKGFIRH